MTDSEHDPTRASVVITPGALESIQRAREAVADGIKHPAWCDPRLCTVEQETGDGFHESTPARIEMSEANAPVALELRLAAQPGGNPLVAMEVHHDPVINAAMELDDEPGMVLLTELQSHQLRDELGVLLAAL